MTFGHPPRPGRGGRLEGRGNSVQVGAVAIHLHCAPFSFSKNPSLPNAVGFNKLLDMTNEALAAMLTASNNASLDDAHPDFPIIRVANAHGEAAIALHGAHVIDFRPVASQPLLYLSPDARFREGTPIRGGVPICWPWFGDHPIDPRKESHGFARNHFWELEGVAEPEENVTEIALRLPRKNMPHHLWAHVSELSLTISVSSALDLALTTTNKGDAPCVVGGALHSYFAVSDIRRISVEGLEGRRYHDKSREGAIGVQEGPIRFDRPVNRIYENTRPLTSIVDPGWQRLIRVDAKGSRTTVVWNSWIEQSKSFKDLPDDGYRHFVCVETANWGDDCPTLAPGESHTLGCRITVE